MARKANTIEIPARVALTVKDHKRLKVTAAVMEIPVYQLIGLCIDAFEEKHGKRGGE